MEHSDRLETGTLERPVEPRRHAGAGPLAAGLGIAVVVLAVAAGLYAWRRGSVPDAPAPQTAAAVQVPAVAPQPNLAPPVRHPIEAISAPSNPSAELPSLAQSDATMREALAGLITAKTLDQLVQSDQFVRRFVATVDNLPRSTLSADMRPLKPAPGALATVGPDGARQVGLDNALRYEGYVNALAALDSRAAVAVYASHYPLFQEAYRELGYPNGYFNDRLVDALDNLLAAPVPAGPVALTQPKVLYEFADPALESLSAGQKALLRMGPANAARVKDKLREIRRIIAAQRS